MPFTKVISAFENKFGVYKTDKNRFNWEKITLDNHDLKLIIRISKWKETTSENGDGYYEVKGKLNKVLLSGEFHKIMIFISEDGKCFLYDENNREKYISNFQEIINSITFEARLKASILLTLSCQVAKKFKLNVIVILLLLPAWVQVVL